MSKQIIYMKHKDEVLLEILKLQRLTFSDDQVEEEAINHGKIQGLLWSAGLFQDNKNPDPFNQWGLPVITGDRDTDALLEDERINQEKDAISITLEDKRKNQEEL